MPEFFSTSNHNELRWKFFFETPISLHSTIQQTAIHNVMTGKYFSEHEKTIVTFYVPVQ